MALLGSTLYLFDFRWVSFFFFSAFFSFSAAFYYVAKLKTGKNTSNQQKSPLFLRDISAETLQIRQNSSTE